MKYKIQCIVPTCLATAWFRGNYDPDTNAMELDDNDKAWNNVCVHITAGGDYQIVDQEAMNDD